MLLNSILNIVELDHTHTLLNALSSLSPSQVVSQVTSSSSSDSSIILLLRSFLLFRDAMVFVSILSNVVGVVVYEVGE
jgi:hypothetical protein